MVLLDVKRLGGKGLFHCAGLVGLPMGQSMTCASTDRGFDFLQSLVLDIVHLACLDMWASV